MALVENNMGINVKQGKTAVFYHVLMTTYCVTSLFFPLICFSSHLLEKYDRSLTVTKLNFYEQGIWMTLVILPLLALSFLKINWKSKYHK